jgi:sulfur-oxidizing protein SoxX
MKIRKLPRPALVPGAAAVLALATLGCASLPSSQELDEEAQAMMKASFREQGIAKLDRLQQDHAQKACSSDKPPADAVARQIEREALASVKWPVGGHYLGDWKAGEKLAQNGRGMTWTDKSASPGANGAQCYNCHQISKQEISFGTIGPSLFNYGKLRGVKDPYAPASAEVVQYTWAKLWNAKAYAACSNMPRFGHMGLLDESQLRDLMALLLDPRSPVNQ